MKNEDYASPERTRTLLITFSKISYLASPDLAKARKTQETRVLIFPINRCLRPIGYASIVGDK